MKTIHELRELLRALRALEASGMREPAALVTVVRTKGSTFRRVGAAMLIHADGSVVNALAGGCPQHDMARRAAEVMRSGQVAYVGYNEEQGLDLLLEMGCGGTLEVVLEPLVSLDHLGFLDALAGAVAAGRPFTLTTEFPPAGADSPAQRHVSNARFPDSTRHEDAAAHSRMTAGGAVELVEAFNVPLSLVVVGNGEEAHSLVRLASGMGITGWLIDPSPDPEDHRVMPEGWERHALRPDAMALATGMGPHAALVVMSHHLERDVAYLHAGARAGVFYLGALGSRERARLIKAAVDAPTLHVPAGLDIGANTPAEIALAILTEIMACRQNRTGRPLAATEGAIHGALPGRA